VSILLAHLGFISEQHRPSWPPTASSVCCCDCSTITREAQAIVVKEFSWATCWGCADAVLGSLVGWTSLAASSWSSDLGIWVACSWHTVLTTRAVTHYSCSCWASAYSVDLTLARETAELIACLESAFTASSVSNGSFSETTHALSVLVSLDTEAVSCYSCNTSWRVRDNRLSWWASTCATRWISILSRETLWLLGLATCTGSCHHKAWRACADTS